MSQPQFHTLKVASVARNTRDAVVVTFDLPAALRETFAFRPGQYLTLRTELNGEEVRRSYSICSAPQDGILRVAIKQVDEGVFSSWANRQLQPGQDLEVMAPAGNFTIDFSPEQQRHYVAFAVGSGITPVFSLVKTALSTEPGSRFTLFFGNRASSSVLFREEIEDLKNRYMERFSLVYIMSRESQDIELFNGRLDGDKVEQLMNTWMAGDDVDYAFVCGPQTMIESVVQRLGERGMDKSRIKFELFGAPKGPRSLRTGREAAVAPGKGQCEVTVIQDGHSRSFSIAKNQDSVLDAALAQGVELPYSCKGGVCSTCRCKVVEGEVDMDANFALEDYEVARGFVLSCQSYPVSDRLVLDFDQET
ncbi:1,2-phenylacetyl-CoA epoxidase subunit PaaE [Bordetella pseudohinzii]|uniref:3-ketosteroid-9-alpha-hydroxylase reductase subunit n=1 Tax=Bordetella pseudohinzii TaxID=1331258 RepID=A0A0J6F3I7_9BORD|nr:1,2-phenylacetyl-CoA epoxidase subunit PaaE [Bordetella pseudohinzii]ANY15641.1 phenylacetic acid degradation protein [Bordetella pseudohinzii]KMM27035.1 phenylacetic acid degradation protein [Bordetella pseudohinzii]KXA78279.1 phenylacetic acid degradation protein [Bordetella pseudohinzii]KXA82360.1 phenylacetic acid degradation protein [Bordetella pseudohinzii]CUI55478.1 3-ketosteroid-9-alpha-hydroxylase reductase subunit [Bordetella pseudohinzii]